MSKVSTLPIRIMWALAHVDDNGNLMQDEDFAGTFPSLVPALDDFTGGMLFMTAEEAQASCDHHNLLLEEGGKETPCVVVRLSVQVIPDEEPVDETAVDLPY